MISMEGVMTFEEFVSDTMITSPAVIKQMRKAWNQAIQSADKAMQNAEGHDYRLADLLCVAE